MKSIANSLIVIICISLLLLGCDSGLTEETLPIETFVASFLETHKDYNTNDITRENANEDFKEAVLDALRKDNILKGTPMKLKIVGRADDKYTAQFQSWIKPNGFEFKEPLYALNFDVVCTIPDSLATKLKDDVYYTIEGHFISRVSKLKEFEQLLGRSTYSVITPLISIEYKWGSVEVDLGMLYYDVTSVKPFTGRKKIKIENKN